MLLYFSVFICSNSLGIDGLERGIEMRKKICMLLVMTLFAGTLFSCHGPGGNSGQKKEHFIVQLDHDYWLSSVGTKLMEHFPDVEFDFVIAGEAHSI